MKAIFCLCLLSLPIVAYASVEDSALYCHGLMVEFQSTTIEHIGYRYRLTDASRITIRVHVGYDSYQHDNLPINSQKNFDYSAVLGYEKEVYRIGSTSLFLNFGIKYGGGRSEHHAYSNDQPPGTYLVTGKKSTIGCGIGIGVEYFITTQLSVFSRQDFEWAQNLYSYTPKNESDITSWTTAGFANARVGLIFYL